MLKLFSHSSFFSQRPKKSISLSGFNMLLAIWLGLILNFAFYQKIHEFTPYANLKAGRVTGRYGTDHYCLLQSGITVAELEMERQNTGQCPDHSGWF